MKDEKTCLSLLYVHPHTTQNPSCLVRCVQTLSLSNNRTILSSFLLDLFLFFSISDDLLFFPVRVFTIIFSSLSAFKAAYKVSTQYSKAPTGNTTWQARSIFHTKKQNDRTQRNEKQTPHWLTCYTLVHNASENRKGRGFEGKCVG